PRPRPATAARAGSDSSTIRGPTHRRPKCRSRREPGSCRCVPPRRRPMPACPGRRRVWPAGPRREGSKGFSCDQPIDRPGHVDVAPREAARIVSGERDLDAVVDVGPLGMMVVPLGQQCDPCHEGEGLAEVDEAEAAIDRAGVVAQGPLGQLAERLGTLGRRELRDSHRASFECGLACRPRPSALTGAAMEPASLSATDLACRRGERLLFRGLSFALQPGDSLQVAGPNGTGKSSLLRILAGLLRPWAGTVERTGEVALLDERLALDGDLPLGRALDVWRRIDGTGYDAEASAALGLDTLLDVPVRFLSTGQRKRAAILVSNARGAGLWLLDEP